MKVPKCYHIGPDGFCEGMWSNDYWSYKKCRFCELFPIDWCGTCKHLGMKGPHYFCAHPDEVKKGFHGWMRLKGSAWITRKQDIGRESGCSRYERR